MKLKWGKHHIFAQGFVLYLPNGAQLKLVIFYNTDFATDDATFVSVVLDRAYGQDFCKGFVSVYFIAICVFLPVGSPREACLLIVMDSKMSSVLWKW